MKIRLFATGLLVIFLLPIGAAAAPADSCTDETYARLGQEERLFRSVLFGLAKTEDMPINAVLTDKDNDVWLKTATNEWKTSSRLEVTRDDAKMNAERDVPARRGILEIQKALSSELIPSVLQAFRATQCRMEAVCLTARLTREAGDDELVKVQPEGCVEFKMLPIESCRAADLISFDNGDCDTQVQIIAERESRILELLFAYDASYRTLMQFAGTFEGFLTDFRFPLLQPLWQMVRTLGQFDNLPCFLAECNE